MESMRRLILALLSTSILTTAVFAQLIGPEIPLAPAASGIGPSSGFMPRVAATGSGYFAVWNDGHGGVNASRLDGRGNLLDPGNLRLAQPPVFGPVAVAAAGTDAVVVMSQFPSITLTRISADGVVSAPRAIGPGQLGGIEMATNGTSFLVVWSGSAEIVDRDGNILAGPFSTAMSQSYATASNGDGYLIAGIDDSSMEVVTLPVGSDGRLGTQQRPTAAPNPVNVAVGSDGSRYIVLSAGDSLVATIIKPDGSEVSTTGLSDQASANPRVAWNGHEYVVAVSQLGMIYRGTTEVARLARLNAAGQPLGPISTLDRIFNVFNRQELDLIGTTGGALVVWSRGMVVSTAIPDAAIDAGTAPAPIVLSMAGPEQSVVRLTRTASGMAAIWAEFSGGSGYLELRLLDDAGQPQPASFKIEVVANRYKLAFDGTNILVASTDGATIAMQRFTATLQPLDLDPVIVATTQSSDFDLAAGGGVALLAWSTPFDPMNPSVIDGVFLRTTDPALEPLPVAIGQPQRMSIHPAVAWNGREFLVSWAHELPIPPPTIPIFPPPQLATHEILGARVGSDGLLLDTTPLSIAVPDLVLSDVEAASNGDGFYVVWGSLQFMDPNPSPYAGQAVYGVRVASDGTAGTPDRLSPADAVTSNLAVAAHDGGDYLVAWTEFTTTDSPVERLEIRAVGNRISPPLAVTPTQPAWLDSPSIVASDAGAVVGYSLSLNQQPYNGASRLFTRTVATSPSLRRRAR
jgi:hypothetical protein